MKPRIAVLGASGKQGGAVLQALLKRAVFEAVAIVRDVNSPAARKLAEQGFQLRLGNLDHPDSLEQAFEGCHGVFLVTDLVSCGGDRLREEQHGKNGADAAKKAGVKHLVFSSLEDPRPGFTEDMPSIHNGSKLPGKMVKVNIEAYIKENGPPASYLITSAYFENYYTWYRYQLQADGTYLLKSNVSTKPFCQNAIADIAESAAVAFERGEDVIGKQIPVVSQNLGMDEAMACISKATGQVVKYEFLPDAEARALPMSSAPELANLYQYFRETDHYERTRPAKDRLMPGIPFQEWALAHKQQLTARLKEATPAGEPYAPYGFGH